MKSFFSITLLMMAGLVQAAGSDVIRVGSLAFGTLGWELAVVRNERLDREFGITLEEMPLANAEAGRVALKGGRVDMILGDWIWVVRQRQEGSDITFAPYSSNHGALMVADSSGVRQLKDLAGKRLGIAGGGMDKNWILLRAMALKTVRLNLATQAEPTYGAPPLLDQELRQGRLDAVLTYWNRAAKLEVEGFRKLLDGRQILKGLGIDSDVPALGYLFREGWARTQSSSLEGFFKAVLEAKRRICESDLTWQRIESMTQESDSVIRQALRHQYCQGRTSPYAVIEPQAVATILAAVDAMEKGAPERHAESLPEGTFWRPEAR